MVNELDMLVESLLNKDIGSVVRSTTLLAKTKEKPNLRKAALWKSALLIYKGFLNTFQGDPRPYWDKLAFKIAADGREIDPTDFDDPSQYTETIMCLYNYYTNPDQFDLDKREVGKKLEAMIDHGVFEYGYPEGISQPTMRVFSGVNVTKEDFLYVLSR